MIKSFKQLNFSTELLAKLAVLASIISGSSSLNMVYIYILDRDDNYRLAYKDALMPERLTMEELIGLEDSCYTKKTYYDNNLIAVFLYEKKSYTVKHQKEIIKHIENIEAFILNAAEEIYNKIQVEIQLTLIHLLRGLNSQFNKEKSVELVLRFIKEQLNYEASYIEVNEDKRIFIPQYATEIRKLTIERVNVPTEMPVQFYKQMQYIKDPDLIRLHFPRFSKALEIKSLISMPIFRQGKLTGLLIVYDRERNRIDKGIISIVKEIAGELIVLFSRIDRQNLNLEKMLSLSAMENLLLYPVEENVNIEEFFYQLLSVLPNVTGMKHCTIAPIDERGERLLIKYTSNEKVKATGLLNKTVKHDKVSELVIKSKIPVVVYDALSDPRCNHSLMRKLGILSFIALPISNINGKVLGVFYLDNEEYQIFTKEQIRFFEVIAKHIGLMISNAVYLEELFIKSRYDGLTGLYNRETFELLYNKLYESYRFDDKKFSVLMLDIDDFKEVNDLHGHQVGDEILKKVAESIMKAVRKDDIVGRYGGEEIIVILKDSDVEDAMLIAERIRSSVAAIAVKEVSVTVSIGISTFRTDSHDKVKLISIADACLYEAKRAGKNHVKSLN